MIGANAYRRLAGECAAALGIMVADSPDPFKSLTQREQDIALLVCQGRSNKQIAGRASTSARNPWRPTSPGSSPNSTSPRAAI